MKESIIEIDNKKIHLVETDKFKSNYVRVSLGINYSKKDYTYLLMLKTVLLYSTKNYPSNRELSIALEELYDARLTGGISIFKNYQILNISLHSLNDKYSESGNTESLFSLLHEVLFNPCIKDNSFDEESFNIAREIIINDINAYEEDKEELARIRMMEQFNYESPLANRDCGYYEELMNITPSSLYDFYKHVINDSMIDAYVVGDISSKEIKEYIDKCITVKGKEIDYQTEYKENLSPYDEIIEEDDITQSKLVIGAYLDEDDKFLKDYAFRLYGIMLGGIPTSKFFMNIREKHSACYYASARAMRANNILLIKSGIDYKNYDLVVSLMKKEMEDMKNGNFTEEDINNGKIFIKTTIESIYDNPISIINSMCNNNYYGVKSNEELVENIDKVTKEDIVRVANKININTIYLLKEVTHGN